MNAEWGKLPAYGEFEIVGARENQPRLLGKGSFGKTFEAIRRHAIGPDPADVIELRAAVKVLNPSLFADRAKRSEFIKEVFFLAKLQNPNLAHYIRGGEEQGEVYCAMELCCGGDLSKLSSRFGPLPEAVVALIGLQAANGLRALHVRHGFVHRDIKPSNIALVDEIEPEMGCEDLAARLDGQENLCQIIDFGLVAAIKHSEDQEAQRKFAGSPMYASPEQIRLGPLDGRSDIYSLGMTLWYLLQGKGPLLDEQGQPLKGVENVFSRHTRPQDHEPDLPEGLNPSFRGLLARMIAKNPNDRFADAAELQEALRQFLREEKPVLPSAKRFPIKRLDHSYRDEYAIGEPFPSSLSELSWLAVERKSGANVRLTVITELEAANASGLYAIASTLSQTAELARNPQCPPGLAPIREVIWAVDALACTEDVPAGVRLADLLKARGNEGRNLPLGEAMTLLRPIAESLDFLLSHGRDKVFLCCDEIRLSSGAAAATILGEEEFAAPLGEWRDLKVSCSLLCAGFAQVGTALDVSQSTAITVRGTIRLGNAHVHPVPALVRLIYRILSGAEAAPATEYMPEAYEPTISLTAASNNLLRDLLCGREPWTTPMAVLKHVSRYEGIPWVESGENGSSQTGSDAVLTKDGAGEKVCEVVRPGLVISPYDPARAEQEVPVRQWSPSGRVRCLVTRKYFRLPRFLDHLVAKALSPGVIQSPYAGPGRVQRVPLDAWIPGGELLCSESGRRITLPNELPLPTGACSAQTPGIAVSPYVRNAAVRVPPEDWVAGGEVVCSACNLPFLLPAELPALEALADPQEPGVLRSPYAPTVTWKIPANQWFAGVEISCPVSHRSLKLTEDVEHWIPDAILLDAQRRSVTNPFRPGTEIQISAEAWLAAGKVICPQTGRVVSLPRHLPPLIGELLPGEVGRIRSPYSGQNVQVQLNDWKPGTEITCPATGRVFRLPDKLPEWLPFGILDGLPPGNVRSPYEQSTVLTLRLEWVEGRILSCPATGRRFKLPTDLPPLIGTVRRGDPGRAQSPYSERWQPVALDEWLAGHALVCAETRRIFVLPETIDEWIEDGRWIPRQPGRITSPFKEAGVVEIASDQFKAGALLTCPRTKRRFRVPAGETLPSLDFEKAVVQQALAAPDQDTKAVTESLRAQFGALSDEQMSAVWSRHRLNESRGGERAEHVSGKPGVVRSPYGSRTEVEVPPELWTKPGIGHPCPETGYRFLLPETVPTLLARVRKDEPGMVVSPFAPDTAFQVSPDDWTPGRAFRCERTGLPLRMPPSLPPWNPVGIVEDGRPGWVRSPFGRHAVAEVKPGKWRPGNVIECPETGFRFALPQQLSPLESSSVDALRQRARSPYAPTCEVEISGTAWRPGAKVTCPETGCIFALPQILPPLFGTPYESRPGAVISPYSSATVQVAFEHWKAGGLLTCPETGMAFVLPPDLPEWILTGSIEGLRPGCAVSPYPPHVEVCVTPEDWVPGGLLVCPHTHRRFRLPDEFPVFEARLTDDPGVVLSPFSGAAQQLKQDEWLAGREIRCKKTGHLFVLPRELPPWNPLGIVNEARPATVFSPFGQKHLVDVGGIAWVAGGSVTCPETGLVFTLPKNLPLLTGSVTPGVAGRVKSPFVTEGEDHLSRKQWVAGAKIVCRRTGRTYLLPDPLPVWENEPKSKLAAPLVIGGILATIALGVWWSISGSGQKPPTATPAPIMAVCTGNLSLPDWEAETPPALQWSCAGSQGTLPLEKDSPKHYRFSSLRLPPTVQKGIEQVEFSVPGWAPQGARVKSLKDGSYALETELLFHRQRVPLLMDLPNDVCDYDFATAQWLRPLEAEPHAPPPPSGSVTLQIGKSAEPIPTGIYDVKLSSGNKAIVESPHYATVRVMAKMPPLELPPSIQGTYWGLVKKNKDTGQAFFIVLVAEAKLARVETRLLQFEKGTNVFRPQGTKPFIGDVWNVKPAATLEINDGETSIHQFLLHFSCPFVGVRLNWTFSNSGDAKYLLKPTLPPENYDVESLQRYSMAHLIEAAKEVGDRGRQWSKTIYHESDVNNFFAYTGEERWKYLQRYYDINDTASLAHYVGQMKDNIARHPEIAVDMYPPSPLVRRNVGDDWDVKPMSAE